MLADDYLPRYERVSLLMRMKTNRKSEKEEDEGRKSGGVRNVKGNRKILMRKI